MIIPILCAILLAIIAILGGVFYVDIEKEIDFQDGSDEDDYQQRTNS